MRTLLALLALSGSAWAQSDRDADLVHTLGGKVRELRAVVGLNPAQEKGLVELFDSLKKDADDFRSKLKEKGADALRADFEKWQEEARAKFAKTLVGDQKGKYDAWLEKKKRLAAEFDKALFGIPPVTEIKLRTNLDEAAAEPMAKAADAAVESIRRRVSKLKSDGAKPEDLAKAVNEERRSGIEKMIESVSGTTQARTKEYVKFWLRTPQEKLEKPEREKLERTLKGLDPKDEAKALSARRLLAAILMHQGEIERLRKGMAKDLLILVLTKKNESEMWHRMNEYGALVEIHERRLKDLYGDAKSLFTSQEIARLVSEGVLE